MIQAKTLIVVLVTLVIGFGAGFVLRPVILQFDPTLAAAAPSLVAPASTVARGKPYFAAHLDEARRIVTDLTATIAAQGRAQALDAARHTAEEAEGRERFRRFLRN